jgi:Domain of unknown function (DUF929)
MSKAQRNRQQSARERIAAQQAAARRAESRRKLLISGGAVLAVIVIVVVLVVVKLNSGSGSGSGGSGSSGGVSGSALPAAVSKNVTTVPSSALDAVGTGTVPTGSHLVKAVSGPPLTNAGKPEMLYIGAEFCPYCAAMRWSMAVSLSQFGTLSSPLHGIRSAGNDVDPNTATLTFYKTTFKSDHLTFTPVENETRTRAPLQATTAAQTKLWKQYEPGGQQGYPFIDFGNKYVITGPLFDPAVLKGLTWQQIATQLRDPSTPVAQSVLGAANFITAAICKTTNGQPGNVCNSKGVTAAAGHLG